MINGNAINGAIAQFVVAAAFTALSATAGASVSATFHTQSGFASSATAETSFIGAIPKLAAFQNVAGSQGDTGSLSRYAASFQGNGTTGAVALGGFLFQAEFDGASQCAVSFRATDCGRFLGIGGADSDFVGVREVLPSFYSTAAAAFPSADATLDHAARFANMGASGGGFIPAVEYSGTQGFIRDALFDAEATGNFTVSETFRVALGFLGHPGATGIFSATWKSGFAGAGKGSFSAVAYQNFAASFTLASGATASVSGLIDKLASFAGENSTAFQAEAFITKLPEFAVSASTVALSIAPTLQYSSAFQRQCKATAKAWIFANQAKASFASMAGASGGFTAVALYHLPFKATGSASGKILGGVVFDATWDGAAGGDGAVASFYNTEMNAPAERTMVIEQSTRSMEVAA